MCDVELHVLLAVIRKQVVSVILRGIARLELVILHLQVSG